jgi:DNA-binding NarL/FixJ family response regulator
MNETPVRVLVVDDSRAFRTVAASVLRRVPGFVSVGQAASAEEALAMLDSLQPDLVLMDIRLPGMNGVEATQILLQRAPGTVVVLCSTYQRQDLPWDVEGSGASGYLCKEDLSPEVIRRLWDGHTPQRTS